jgi:hypothetical protein
MSRAHPFTSPGLPFEIVGRFGSVLKEKLRQDIEIQTRKLTSSWSFVQIVRWIPHAKR